MSKTSGYEAPRAVRLGDCGTGEFMCVVGTFGQANACVPHGTMVGQFVCFTGTQVACVTGSGVIG